MIKLHYLNRSRAKRILWLLEEIGQPYETVVYQRDAKTSLAPAELKQVHPLGKSPVIELDGFALAESGAGGADDLGFVEQLVEERPGIGAGIDPEVRRVIAADAREAEFVDGL